MNGHLLLALLDLPKRIFPLALLTLALQPCVARHYLCPPPLLGGIGMGPPGVPRSWPFIGPFTLDASANFFRPGPLREPVLLLASRPRFAFCPNLNLLYNPHLGPRNGNTIPLHDPSVGKVTCHGIPSSGKKSLARSCLFVKHACGLLLSGVPLSGIGKWGRS